MLDKPNSNRSERKSSIISKELQKYIINIAALCKIRFAKNGNIKNEMGYTFYWSKKTSTDRSESGVALAVRNDLLLSLSEDPKPVSNRLITQWFPLVTVDIVL